MKRIFTLIAAALLVCLMAFAVTSCGKTEVTIGENGNWYLDGVDTGKKAVGTDAEKVTVGENGNWFIGAEDTGVKAVTGKYVVDVTTTTEYEPKYGKQYAVTVITYSDGTTETQRNEIPVRIENIHWDGVTTFYAGYTPVVYIEATTANYDYINIKVTDDMYVGDKPDFNTPGIYNVMIAYGGQLVSQTIEVLDAADASVSDIYIDYSCIRKGTPFSEAVIYVVFDSDYSYRAYLSDCSDVSISDFNTVGEIKFNVTYKDYTGELFLEVYDPEVNLIRGVWISNHFDITIKQNADADAVKEAFKNAFAGIYIYADLYEEIYGTSYLDFAFTLDMLDLSTLDTSMLGQQIVKLTGAIDGVGSYTEDLYVTVYADLSEAALIKSYEGDGMLASMFGSISLYDNGVAVFSSEDVQGVYTRNENVIAVVTSGMTMYFTVDDGNNTYDAYAPEGTPTATYTNVDEEMQVKVYSDYVTVCTYSPANGDQPEICIPLLTLSASAIQNNTLSVMGTTLLLNSDGTLDLIY